MKKEPKPKILKVVRTDAFVKIRQEVARNTEQKTTPDKSKPGETVTKQVTSSRELEETAHEAPLPAFDEAMQDLAAVACKTLGLPPDYKKGVTIVSVALSYTEHGIRSAQIGFVKQIDATNTLHPLKTPMFQIDDGKTADQGRRQCAPTHAEDVIAFIKEAQKYAAGERSQQLLNWEEEKEDEDDDKIEQLPGMAGKGTVDSED